MGQVVGTWSTKHLDLNMNDQPTFDKSSGFGFTRKERKMLVCEDHLSSARIPPKYRDYCAHLLLDYQVCRYKQMPFVYKCHHEKHAYLECEKDDYVLRLKEFERERRLRERELRIKKAEEDKKKAKEPPKPPPKEPPKEPPKDKETKDPKCK